MSAELINLIRLWRRLLPGVPIPCAAQWELWATMFSTATLRTAIIETSKKCLRLGREMDQDFAVRFASKVANTRSRAIL